MLLKSSSHRAVDISAELTFKAQEKIRGENKVVPEQKWTMQNSHPYNSETAPKCKSHLCASIGLFGSGSMLQRMGRLKGKKLLYSQLI